MLDLPGVTQAPDLTIADGEDKTKEEQVAREWQQGHLTQLKAAETSVAKARNK